MTKVFAVKDLLLCSTRICLFAFAFLFLFQIGRAVIYWHCLSSIEGISLVASFFSVSLENLRGHLDGIGWAILSQIRE